MALSSLTTWEVRTTGSDSNSGGFDSSISGGTDYSQQDTAQVTFNGTSITASNGASSSTITLTGYTVSTNDKGNILRVTGGTNFTTGYYAITSVNTGANTWTLDRTITTAAGSAMTGVMGGAFLTIAQPVNTVMSTSGTSKQNIIYVKAGSGYTITSTIQLVGSRSVSVIGYTTTRGDGGTVTVTCNTNSVTMITSQVADIVCSYRFENFTFQHTAATRGAGYSFASASSDLGPMTFVNCTFDGCSDAISTTSNFLEVRLINCVFKNCTTSGVTLTYGGGFFAIDCMFYNNGTDGLILNGSRTRPWSYMTINRCVFANNTGKGLSCTNNPNNAVTFVDNCVFYSNGSDGLKYNTTVSVDLQVRNSVFVNNGGWGINVTNGGGFAWPYDPGASQGDGNAFYNNTSGQVTNFLNTNAITLSGVPFTNAGSQDFSLDNTASEGALLRGTARPGAKRGGGTQYLDVGAFQHTDPAASGGVKLVKGFRGGF